MEVTRTQFVLAIEAGITASPGLSEESRQALREVAQKTSGCILGDFDRSWGLIFEEDIEKMQCPVVQAGIRHEFGTTTFAVAFDAALSANTRGEPYITIRETV